MALHLPRVLALWAFVVAGLAIAAPEQASARSRGPSQAQIKAMQQQMQMQQQMAENYEKAKAKKDQETLARFDTNGNGKLDPNEKPAFDKFMREVKLGKVPHPYDSITEADIKPVDPKKAAADAAKKKKT